MNWCRRSLRKRRRRGLPGTNIAERYLANFIGDSDGSLRAGPYHMPGRHNHDPKGDFVRITIPQKEIRVFTISPRTLGLEKYWKELQETVTWSGHFNCTGILIFTGNDTYIDPWLVAASFIANRCFAAIGSSDGVKTGYGF